MNSDTLKIFLLNNLLLEKDLEKLEGLGIEIGHTKTIQRESPVDLDLFDDEIRKRAQKMADFYVIYFCMENSIRGLISGKMEEKYGHGWWDTKVPQAVKDEVTKRQQQEKDAVISLRSDDPLSYTNFGELIQILNSNWTDFTDLIRSQKAMEKILSGFNSIRNVIAHSCELSDDDRTRIELQVKDWLRIQT